MERYDIIVVGGGIAGSAAALSAARAGQNVLLIEKSNALGGTATNCLVNPFMPYSYNDPETNEKVALSRGIFTEILERLRECNCLYEYHDLEFDTAFNEEYLKLILNRMLIQAGAKLLFHSCLVESTINEGHIESITVVNKSGKQTYYADCLIDATGDGDLAAMSGCSFQLGREEDNLCQPMTLCFRVGNVDVDAYIQNDRKEAIRLYKEYKEAGRIKNVYEKILTFRHPSKGVLHFNSTRIVKKNPVDAMDITEAEIEAREQAFELFAFMKEHVPSFKDAILLSTAASIGVRESRMIEGEYTLTQEDLLNLTKFEDSIAAGNYDIDIHNPEGSGTTHHYFKSGEYYTIPYRCLTPKKTDNLLVAGRCISATHEAQASCRIMPICFCLGQAAGTAAALATKNKTGVKSIDIKELRTKLIEADAFI